MNNKSSQNIVLLHGWTPDETVIDRWQPLKKLLEKAGHKVHLWKIPGLTTEANKSFTIDEYQAWLFKKIEPMNSVILVGHSFGGQLATVFASKHPELIKKLVLINSSGIRDFTPKKVIKRNVLKTLSKIGFILKEISFLKKILYRVIGEKDYLEANNHQKKTINNALNYSVKPLLSEITIPTLILWGIDDQTTPIYLGRIFQENIPNNEFVELPTRHSPTYTHPKLVFNQINKFIKEKSI